MRLPGPIVAALTAMVDEAVEQVRQQQFGQFMALRSDPMAVHARVKAAEDVGQRFKAQLRGLTDG